MTEVLNNLPISTKAEPFCHGGMNEAKVLVIGHDPRLQKSDTIAGFALFADYFFRDISSKPGERAKYGLAKSTYEYISELTGHKYNNDQVIMTNLCNSALPHAPKGTTVLITEDYAKAGLKDIRELLLNSRVEVIFAMSQQVNYWLQKLEFYTPVAEFIDRAESKSLTCYQPRKPRAFQIVCGNQYSTSDGRNMYPILHVKNWPLIGNFAQAYSEAYTRLATHFKPD